MIKTKKWVIWAVIGGLAIVLLVLLIVLVTRGNDETMSAADEQANQELYENGFDEAALPESLNAELARAVARGAYAEYSAEQSETAYVGLMPRSLCGALNLDYGTLNSPATSASLERTTALNANAIDHYLDESGIVEMVSEREDAYVPEMLVVYGRQGAFYLAFDPAELAEPMYLTRAELFEGVIGVPEFYIMKGMK